MILVLNNRIQKNRTLLCLLEKIIYWTRPITKCNILCMLHFSPQNQQLPFTINYEKTRTLCLHRPFRKNAAQVVKREHEKFIKRTILFWNIDVYKKDRVRSVSFLFFLQKIWLSQPYDEFHSKNSPKWIHLRI